MTVDVLAPAPAAGVLTDDALAFLAALHERFEPRRRELLDARAERRARIAAGETLDFLRRHRARSARATGRSRRRPPDLQDRRVEITGPVDRKMVINALNSGARGFMADFEDSLLADVGQHRRGPGQPHRRDRGHDRVHRRRRARVQARRRGRDAARAPARLAPAREARARRRRAGRGRLRRRRALPLAQRPGACSTRARARTSTCPRWSRHLEARLWTDVFAFAEDELGLDPGTIRARC